MNEFLKLCNLFSQDLIDRHTLVSKVSGFIGGSPELMRYFKDMVRFDGNDEIIENVPKAPSGRVSLSNCRAMGPSYRLLPKRVSSNFYYRCKFLPNCMHSRSFKVSPEPLASVGLVGTSWTKIPASHLRQA